MLSKALRTVYELILRNAGIPDAVVDGATD
jgi:hypothetical protein